MKDILFGKELIDYNNQLHFLLFFFSNSNKKNRGVKNRYPQIHLQIKKIILIFNLKHSIVFLMLIDIFVW